MSRCVFASQRSLEETGRPLGPMKVRTVAEVAVTSWTDSDRRTCCEGEEDEEEDDEEEEEDEEEDEAEEDEDEEEDVELVLLLLLVVLVEASLAPEDLRRRTVREVGVNMVLELGPACGMVRVAEIADTCPPPRGESVFVTTVEAVDAAVPAPADDDAGDDTASESADVAVAVDGVSTDVGGRLADDEGNASALAKMTPFSATTS